MGEQNGWSEYQKLVLHEIQRLSDNVDKLSDLVSNQKIELESLKLKTGFIATLAGFTSSIGFNIGKFFIER